MINWCLWSAWTATAISFGLAFVIGVVAPLNAQKESRTGAHYGRDISRTLARVKVSGSSSVDLGKSAGFISLVWLSVFLFLI